MERNYYCPNMSKDIQGWIEQCKRCTIAKDVFPRIQAQMTCSNVMAPLEVLALDYTQLKRSSGGYENVLVLTDIFSFQLPSQPRIKQGVPLQKPSSNIGLSTIGVQLVCIEIREDVSKSK